MGTSPMTHDEKVKEIAALTEGEDTMTVVITANRATGKFNLRFYGGTYEDAVEMVDLAHDQFDEVRADMHEHRVLH